jgi:predicted metal-binding protein
MKYQLKNIVTTIKVDEYIRDYRDADRFIEYCKACPIYNACWACPPFDFDTTGILLNYKNAHLIGTKIILDKAVLSECTGREQCTEAAHRITKEVRIGLDDKLLALERKNSGSRAFLAGTCYLCREGTCTRIFGKPCLHPDRVRPSLESFGFDISKTASRLLHTELIWGSENRLPEYFLLVSALLTDEKVKYIALQA